MNTNDENKIKRINDTSVLFCSAMVAVSAIIVLLGAVLIAFFTNIDIKIAALIIAVALFNFAICVVVSSTLEYVAGYYKCKKCGHTHFPESETEVVTSMHIGWSRYIKCPNCNKRSWHKKVLTKDKE